MANQQSTDNPMWQHVCVASLVGHCESIAASGRLEPPAEQSLRLLIAETLSAFGMDHHSQEQTVA